LAAQLVQARISGGYGGVAFAGSFSGGFLLPAEVFCVVECSVTRRVKAVVCTTTAAQDFPAIGLPVVACALGIRQPGEQIVNEVLADQRIEIGAVECTTGRRSLQFGHRDIDELIEAAANGRRSRCIPGDLESEPPI